MEEETNNKITEEYKEGIAIIENELRDQKDFIAVLVGKFEELYELKSKPDVTDFQVGFHIGELYKQLLQFQTDSANLSNEIISFLGIEMRL